MKCWVLLYSDESPQIELTNIDTILDFVKGKFDLYAGWDPQVLSLSDKIKKVQNFEIKEVPNSLSSLTSTESIRYLKRGS